jgi:RNA polymerase sigma-B factor
MSFAAPRGSVERRDPADLFARLPDDPAARDDLITTYAPLARALAKRFDGRREPLDDLIQVAMLGLIKAVDRFEPSRDVQFTTYATVTIVGELKRHFRDKGWAVHVPRRLQEWGLVVSQTASELSQQLGRSPTVAEIARQAGLSDENVLEAMEAMNAYSAKSLDVPVDEGGVPAVEMLEDDDDALERSVGWAMVAPAIRALPPRERRILYLRFYHGKTQSEIAVELGMSQMHVSRLLSRTLDQLRATVGADQNDADEDGAGGGADFDGDADGNR